MPSSRSDSNNPSQKKNVGARKKSVAEKNAVVEKKSVAHRDASGNSALYPPDSTVNVPNLPHPDPSRNEAAKQSQPAENDRPESNWADDGLPAPNAKNARSSLL